MIDSYVEVVGGNVGVEPVRAAKARWQGRPCPATRKGTAYPWLSPRSSLPPLPPLLCTLHPFSLSFFPLSWEALVEQVKSPMSVTRARRPWKRRQPKEEEW